MLTSGFPTAAMSPNHPRRPCVAAPALSIPTFRILLIFSGLSLTLLFGACATPQSTFRKTGVGHFHGYPQIYWKAPNSFTFIQNDRAPFYYVTSPALGSQKIVPRTMKTDGGSIPRPFWVFTDLTPWRFLPAYLIHDWLFEQHIESGNRPDEAGFQRSADILAEGVKTLMVTRCDMGEHPFVLWGITAAARSDIARKRWNGIPPDPSECTTSGRDCIVRGSLCAERQAGQPCRGPHSKCGGSSSCCTGPGIAKRLSENWRFR